MQPPMYQTILGSAGVMSGLFLKISMSDAEYARCVIFSNTSRDNQDAKHVFLVISEMFEMLSTSIFYKINSTLSLLMMI